MAVQIPEWIQEKVDEIRLVNRLAFGGFTMTAGTPEGGDQGGDQGQAGEQGQDDLFEQGGGDGGQGGDEGGDQGEQLSPAMQALITREANRIADQRINQVLQRQGGQRGGQRRQQAQQQPQQQQQQQGQQEQQQQPQAGSPAVSPGDLREARLVYREYVTDQIRFVGDEERAFAADLATSMIPGLLEKGLDIEDAGRQVAQEVAARVKKTRTFYQQQTIKALQQRGALPEDYRPGQPPKGPAQTTGSQNWKSGEDRARQMYADRLPAQTN